MYKSKPKYNRKLRNLYACFWGMNCHSWIKNISRVILDWGIFRISIRTVCLIMRRLLKLLRILLRVLQEHRVNLEDWRNRTLQWRLWFLIVRNWKGFLIRRKGILGSYAILRRRVMLKESKNLNPSGKISEKKRIAQHVQSGWLNCMLVSWNWEHFSRKG